MSSPPINSSKPTATILAWPAGQSDDQILAILQRAGFGEYESKQLSRREAPFFLGRVKPDFASVTQPVLETAGIQSLVLTQEQIDSVPKFLLSKNLHAAIGAPRPVFAVEPWRGEGTILNMDDVFLIIRASVGRSKSTVEAMPRSFNTTPGALLLPGEAAVEYALSSGQHEPQFSKTIVTDAAEVIEMYRLDGTRVRVNSEKFNFEILGKSKGITDRQNVDSLMLLLSELAVNAEIDLDFRKFKAPPNTIKSQARLGVTGAAVKTVDAWPSFEFYSVWRYLVQRVRCGLTP